MASSEASTSAVKLDDVPWRADYEQIVREEASSSSPLESKDLPPLRSFLNNDELLHARNVRLCFCLRRHGRAQEDRGQLALLDGVAWGTAAGLTSFVLARRLNLPLKLRYATGLFVAPVSAWHMYQIAMEPRIAKVQHDKMERAKRWVEEEGVPEEVAIRHS